MRRVLVTGGAGFIGRQVVGLLVQQGYQVVVLDNLTAQVHGSSRIWPAGQNQETVSRCLGDVRNPDDCREALRDCDAVIHLAAQVGVGQGQYEIASYTGHNVFGTAQLLEQAIPFVQGGRLRTVVIASSMSAYGEGAYWTVGRNKLVRGWPRPMHQLAERRWDLYDETGAPLLPAGVVETDELRPAGIYALTKAEQERMGLLWGEAYDCRVAALRLFNAYGPGQALSNPYTGVGAIFSNQVRAGTSPTVYEDGKQQRDFIHVQDVAAAFCMALEHESCAGVLNVGTGRPTSVLELAERIIESHGQQGKLKPNITGKFRSGDIRSCIANSAKLQALGWKPRVSLEAGLDELCAWSAGQDVHRDVITVPELELRANGLLV